MSRRGVADILVVVLIVVILIWLFNVVSYSGVGGYRGECSRDNQCRTDQYCGSDFTCHNMPVIKQETVTKEIRGGSASYNFTGTAVVLGFFGVIIAIILRWEKLFPRKGKKAMKPEVFYETQSKE